MCNIVSPEDETCVSAVCIYAKGAYSAPKSDLMFK